MKRIKLLFAWYDLWVGVYWQSKDRTLYILPLPMIGIKIHFTKYVLKEKISVFIAPDRQDNIMKIWTDRHGRIRYDTKYCNSLKARQLTKP